MKIYIQEKGGRVREFDGAEAVVGIGRGADNQVVIKDPRSSRRHCRVLETPQGYFLEDLDSRNGTALNGSKIKRSALSPGDVFQIGSTRFHFEVKPASKGRDGANPDDIDFEEVADGPDEISPDPISQAATLAVPGARAPERRREELEDDGGIVLEEVELESAESPPRPRRSEPAVAKPGPKAKPAPLTTEDAYLEGLKGLHVGERIPITKVPYTIGRKADNDFRLEDPRASGHHLRIARRHDTFYLEDLDSKNGTFINGKPIRGEVRLAPGMRLQVGDCQYRVQVPGTAGDAAAAGEAESDPASEYELSRFKVEEFLQESRRSGHPLVALGILVILGALLYFAVDVALKVVRRNNPDPRVEGNLLLENWSFEEPPEKSTGELAGWTLAAGSGGTIERTNQGAQYPGYFALRLAAGAGAEELTRAVCTEPIRVTSGTRYYVSGHVTNQSSSLGAGLLVRWLRGGRDDEESPQEIARTYTNAVTQVGYGEETGRWVTAPENVALAEIDCFVLGGGGYFDRIYFGGEAPPWQTDTGSFAANGGEDGEDSGAPVTGPAPQVFVRDEPVEFVVPRPSSEQAPARETALPIKTQLESNGTLTGMRRGQRLPLVAAMWPGLPPDKDPLGLGPRLACEPFASQETVLRLSGQVPDLVEESWCPLEINVQTDGGQLACRYRYRKVAERELPAVVAVYFELARSRTPAKAFGDGDVLELGSTQVPARELVVGDGSEQIVFQLDPPLILQKLERRNWIVGTATLDRGQGADLRIVLSRTSRREEQTIRAITDEARKLYAEGELSGATQLLRGIIDNYPWRRGDIERTREILAEWSEEGDRALDEIDANLALLNEIPSELVYANLLARCQTVLERHRGTPVATSVTAKMDAARAHWKELESTAEARRREALFDKGMDHFSRNEIHLAEFCLREVKRTATDEELIARIDERLQIIDKKKQTKALRDG